LQEKEIIFNTQKPRVVESPQVPIAKLESIYKLTCINLDPKLGITICNSKVARLEHESNM
jgi:hypothetical protein